MTIDVQITGMVPRLRIAGGLIILGLLIEAFTLTWNNPVAFVVFLGIGGVLIGLGVLIYLISLVTPPAEVGGH
jgi:uncharacterized membrane protein YczE